MTLLRGLHWRVAVPGIIPQLDARLDAALSGLVPNYVPPPDTNNATAKAHTESTMLAGNLNYRFLGGKWNGQWKEVPSSTNEVSTVSDVELTRTPVLRTASPLELQLRGETLYRKVKIALQSETSEYSEHVFVDVALTDWNAKAKFSAAVREKIVLPTLVETVPVRHDIKSSVIHSLAYNQVEKVLDITMKESNGQPGKTYRYRGVPINVVGELLVAPSAGRYYARSIKNHFDSVQLTT